MRAPGHLPGLSPAGRLTATITTCSASSPLPRHSPAEARARRGCRRSRSWTPCVFLSLLGRLGPGSANKASAAAQPACPLPRAFPGSRPPRSALRGPSFLRWRRAPTRRLLTGIRGIPLQPQSAGWGGTHRGRHGRPHPAARESCSDQVTPKFPPRRRRIRAQSKADRGEQTRTGGPLDPRALCGIRARGGGTLAARRQHDGSTTTRPVVSPNATRRRQRPSHMGPRPAPAAAGHNCSAQNETGRRLPACPFDPSPGLQPIPCRLGHTPLPAARPRQSLGSGRRRGPRIGPPGLGGCCATVAPVGGTKGRSPPLRLPVVSRPSAPVVGGFVVASLLRHRMSISLCPASSEAPRRGAATPARPPGAVLLEPPPGQQHAGAASIGEARAKTSCVPLRLVRVEKKLNLVAASALGLVETPVAAARLPAADRIRPALPPLLAAWPPFDPQIPYPPRRSKRTLTALETWQGLARRTNAAASLPPPFLASLWESPFATRASCPTVSDSLS